MFDFLRQLTDSASILEYGGLLLLLIVIFAETGLLIGFFLPGDYLVFLAGVVCVSTPELLGVNLPVLIISMSLAAILGNITGYWFGYKIGPPLFKREDSWIFKKKYLERTKDFYERNGRKTLILGRFIPYVRTFAPIFAGIIRLDWKQFMIYNIVGAFAWIAGLTGLGYYFGRFEFVHEHIDVIILGFIIVSTIPIITTFLREKNRKT